jgi:hypothetical protein
MIVVLQGDVVQQMITTAAVWWNNTAMIVRWTLVVMGVKGGGRAPSGPFQKKGLAMCSLWCESYRVTAMVLQGVQECYRVKAKVLQRHACTVYSVGRVSVECYQSDDNLGNLLAVLFDHSRQPL